MNLNIIWLLFVVLIILILYIIYSDKYQNSIINDLKKGDSQEYVLKKLGKPSEVIKCPENLWWESKFIRKDINKDCKTYYIYSGKILQRWGIGFDKNKKIISKYIYMSE